MNRDDPPKTAPVPPTARALEVQARRQEAAAKALRANLLRRKQQQRARPEAALPARKDDTDQN